MSKPVQPFTVPPTDPAQTRGPTLPLWAVYVAGVLTGVVILAGSVGASVAQTPRLAAGSVAAFGLFAAACTLLLNRIPYFRPIAWETGMLGALWGGGAAAVWGGHGHDHL